VISLHTKEEKNSERVFSFLRKRDVEISETGEFNVREIMT